MNNQRTNAGNIIPYRRDDQSGREHLSGFDLVGRIEQHALDAPERRAVTFGATSWSYGQLVAEADRLVHRLRAEGIGRQDRIAVCAAPDLYVPVALLAILKLGAVYVPIGDGYPSARIRAVVDDVVPTIVLTAGGTGALFEGLRVRTADLADLCAPADVEAAPPASVDDADDAYIFYTSGTTGAPKGIAVGYGALRFYIDSAIETYGMDGGDIMLSTARYAFSISLFELLAPLVAGGTLWLLERDRVMTAPELSSVLQQATIAHIGPSLMQRLLDHVELSGIEPQSFDRLRHISSGGDVVPPELLERMKQSFQKAEIFVIYGCTEIACMGCSYAVPRDQVVDKTYVGKPFAGAEMLLLGDDDQPVATGETGEVLFAGPGLLNGYVNKPHLTEKKRVVRDGKTYFRTGDVGRLAPSGNLELLGRQDFQIKIRGLRIEPVEIEVHLRRVPGVREAAVAAADSRSGSRQLVAYLVTDADSCPSIPVIREHLSEHLPTYMIPTVYALLESLPLNHNLKLDRNALPPPETCRLLAVDEQVPPRTETETTLVDIWRAELGQDAVGITNDFFDLGGDSLMAVTLCLLVSEAFGVAMRPSDLYEKTRTIEALAGLIDRRRAAAGDVQADDTALDRTAEDQPLLLLPPAVRFLKERDNLDPHRWNIAQLLESSAPLDPKLVEQAVSLVAKRHDSLDFRLAADGEHWFSLPEDEAGAGMFGHVDLAAVPDNDLPQAIADHAEQEQAGLSLHDGPVVRIMHIDLGPARPHRLLVIAHHLAVDGTSWPVLVRDLVWTYEWLSGHRARPLSGRTGSYRAWGRALAAMGQDPSMLAEVDAWTDRPWQAVKPLPRNPSGQNTNQSARTVEAHLSLTETEQLRERLPRGASTTELLIPTLARALAKWIGSEWVLIDSLEDGRTLPKVDTVFTQSIGFMGCYIPLLLQAGQGSGQSLDDLGSAVRDGREQGYVHDVLRYLADDASVRQRMAALPRAQVIFNYGRNMRSFLPDDTLFEDADESPGNTHNPLNARDYALGAVADRVRGQLALKLVYSRNLHTKEDIHGLLDDWVAGLRSLV